MNDIPEDVGLLNAEKLMKVLIIGKSSYIGTHIRDYLTAANAAIVDEFDAHRNGLEAVDFDNYDSVVMVAALVHRKDIKDWNIYKQVNAALPVKAARLAKKAGVKQFVFLSSAAVYGIGKRLEGSGIITIDTEKKPVDYYGRSKWLAEKKLLELQSEAFSIAIIEPMNVYGKDCPGNYISKFCRITKMMPALPDCYRDVKQGMLYIDNLCELVKRVIGNIASGIYPAQDAECLSAYDLMKLIAEIKGWEKKSSKLFGNMIKGTSFLPHIVKLFGGVKYADEYSKFDGCSYEIETIYEGMKKTLS